jgi:hypothetical protein
MKARAVCVFLSIFGVLSLASPAALAQRGGHGGGYGGGMGGYGGMPSGTQPGGRTGAPSSVQPGERPGAQAGTERSVGSDRGSGSGKTPGELLQQNTKLSENLSKLLPAGTDLQSAAYGFKNLGEFAAAVHVSHNLGIPFADLKAKMMSGDSLGQAIRTLRPEADFQAEARKAQAQAREGQGT